MANMHLVTGYANKEHIKSADQGSFNAAMLGEGDLFLKGGTSSHRPSFRTTSSESRTVTFSCREGTSDLMMVHTSTWISKTDSKGSNATI